MEHLEKNKIFRWIPVLLIHVFLVVGLLSLLVKPAKKDLKGPTPKLAIPIEQEKGEQNKEQRIPNTIRVVIKTTGFKGMKHSKVILQAESGLVLTSGENSMEYEANKPVEISGKDDIFQKGSIWIEPKEQGDKIQICSLKRGYGVPSYRGKMQLFSDGKQVVLVNELPLEEYLYAVVPSEMMASYPMEALKVQAVCARSFAAKQMEEVSYPEYQAHVDDSVSFQVYGNSKEQEQTNQAVDETAGEKVWYNDEVVSTYYYSTSCGRTTSAEAWGTKPSKANAYLKSVELKGKDGCYEKDYPWFSWKATVSNQVLEKCLKQDVGEKIGKLKNVKITERGPGNVALKLHVIGTKGEVTVETENKIRRALGGVGYEIERNDGKKVKSSELLPSAFFEIKKEGSTYRIQGGGYGHGIGMSQNGANEMAKEGMNYKQILHTFYRDIEIKK